MALAGVVVVPWLVLRAVALESSTSVTVLAEWLLFFAIAYVVSKISARNGLAQKGVASALSLVVAGLFIGASILNVSESQVLKDFGYWSGFGAKVLLASTVVSLFLWLSEFIWTSESAHRRLKMSTWLPIAQRLVGLLVILWCLPSILQPMDSWIRLTDSTEKVLDEIAGWVNGFLPGYHTGWIHGSLLGLPLWPLSWIPGNGTGKVVLIVLYVNALMVVVPILIGQLIRLCLPMIERTAAIAIGFVVVSISGQNGNTALFQELSFLARGVMPIALGYFVVRLQQDGRNPTQLGMAMLGLFSAATLLNNYEYGVGAAGAAFTTVAVSKVGDSYWSSLKGFLIGIVGTSVLFVVPGTFVRGDWIGKRLGAWSDVISGDATQHSNNSGENIPIFGLATLFFVLTTTLVAMSFRPGKNYSRIELSAPLVCARYFSLWSLLSLPYFLNGGGQGAFRTQFLLIPCTIMVASSLGLRSIANRDTRQYQQGSYCSRCSRILGRVSGFPLLLLCALLVSCLIQTPNGIREWRRVQTPNGVGQEWSYMQLYQAQADTSLELADEFGGSKNVGWWFSYGNAMEIVTGIDNLLGVNGFEAMRSKRMLEIGCYPLLETPLRYVMIQHEEMGVIEQCSGLEVRIRSGPDGRGFSVVEISRT